MNCLNGVSGPTAASWGNLFQEAPPKSAGKMECCASQVAQVLVQFAPAIPQWADMRRCDGQSGRWPCLAGELPSSKMYRQFPARVGQKWVAAAQGQIGEHQNHGWVTITSHLSARLPRAL